MGRPAFSPVALSWGSCTSIFQPNGYMRPLQKMIAQMRRSFSARRLLNETYALFNGPWNLFQPDGAIPLRKRIPRHHGITPRTQSASAMCGAPRLDSRGFLRRRVIARSDPLLPIFPYIQNTYSRPTPHARTLGRPTLLRSQGNFSIFFRQECRRPISFSKHIEIRSTSFSLRTRRARA